MRKKIHETTSIIGVIIYSNSQFNFFETEHQNYNKLCINSKAIVNRAVVNFFVKCQSQKKKLLQ
jgi:hypothetical protein